ncbi:MAG: iron-containing alcohol dehydrogenase [Moorea sp. SIO3G5]|nr:iron-containing alcohol dehydrogenase [Moorena sp. SIO3G5]
MKTISFNFGEDLVPFYIGSNCLYQLATIIKQFKFDKLFIGFDDHSKFYHGARFLNILDQNSIPYSTCVIPPGENNKTLENLDDILSTFIQKGCTRQSIIIPFGGGIVGNIFGLAAGLLYRGIRLIHFPTTFLAVHDSVTSQKQAINYLSYKNTVGLFHLPTAVIHDTSVLTTLDQKNIKSGLGELVKNAILFGDEFYDVLINQLNCHKDLKFSSAAFEELVISGINAKNRLLKHDAREKNTGIVFEYGHTIGHAIELSCPHNSLSHGEAVAIGMLAASWVANKMGIMSDEDRAKHDQLIEKIHPRLPILDKDIFLAVWHRVLHDNKRGYVPTEKGIICMILAKRIGELHQPNPYYLEAVPEEIVAQAIRYVLGKTSSGLQHNTPYQVVLGDGGVRGCDRISF